MENTQIENTGNATTDLLDEETGLLNQYDYASTGQRFLNWIIDNLLIRFTLNYLTGYGVGIVIGLAAPEIIDDLRKPGFTVYAVLYLLLVLNYLFYYILFEKLFNGYTLGKLITGTRTIRDDGNPLTMKDVLLRTLIRLVPFEVLSGFKIRPWHDEWSKTMVIKSR